MNSFQKLLAGLLFILVAGAMACGKDNDPEPCNYAVELQAEINALNNALNVYVNDPSQANCISYRNALQAYVNAADEYSECSALAGQQAEFEAYLDSVQASIDALQC